MLNVHAHMDLFTISFFCPPVICPTLTPSSQCAGTKSLISMERIVAEERHSITHGNPAGRVPLSQPTSTSSVCPRLVPPHSHKQHLLFHVDPQLRQDSTYHALFCLFCVNLVLSSRVREEIALLGRIRAEGWECVLDPPVVCENEVYTEIFLNCRIARAFIQDSGCFPVNFFR